MGQPAYPVRYTVVPLIGPDGVGKTTLLRLLGGHVQQRDHLPAPPLRAASGALVLDTRGVQGVYQLVDFESSVAQAALLVATPFQGALLAVSALDGVQPGTVDSLVAARNAAIVRIAVALTKCDQIEDPELLDLVSMEVREMLNKYECSGDTAPVVRVGAGGEGRAAEQWWRATGELLQAVQAWIP